MSLNRMFTVSLFALTLGAAPVAMADAGVGASASVAVAVDVSAAGKAAAALGDKLYAAGDYKGALLAYGDGFAKTRDAAFIYASAQCHSALAHKDDAETMFKMYLAAAGKTKLKYETEAKAALGGAKGVGKAVVGGIVGAAKAVGGTVLDLTGFLAGGIYSALKVSIAAEIEAGAKAKAEAADAAYAAAKYGEAAKSYAQVFASAENPVALFAQAQAEAQAGHAAEARALMNGYLTAVSKGKHVDEAKQLMLAMGGAASSASATVAVKAKVAAELAASVNAADAAYKAGKFATAAKGYGEAYAKKAEPVLLYAKGMAEYNAGLLADAQKDLKAYLAAGGGLEFKTNAELALKASASGSAG